LEIDMKNGILRAALLGIVASASFSLTQAASLAATSPEQAKANICLVSQSQAAGAADPRLTAILEHPEVTDRFLLLGGH
jgi:hypothetical protein